MEPPAAPAFVAGAGDGLSAGRAGKASIPPLNGDVEAGFSFGCWEDLTMLA